MLLKNNKIDLVLLDRIFLSYFFYVELSFAIIWHKITYIISLKTVLYFTKNLDILIIL